MKIPFFDEMGEQSLIKATIVSRYFWRWAKIIIATAKNNEKKYGRKESRIAYIDLFAGPGRYKEGSKSTPLLVLEEAIKDEDIRQRLLTMFNDKDEANARSLEKAISELPGIERLKHKPLIMNQEIGTEIVKIFEQMKLVPTLFFVDPFGYKGLSLPLINSVLQNWGCDCIFFFNYNRISMGLPKEYVREHMNALFGEENADALREKLELVKADERELVIVETLAQSLKAMGGEYVLPFRFKNARGTRTSHHLIFVSKHFKGYETMKQVMAEESSSHEQGVPSFEYNPATERQPLLFELNRRLDELGDMLLNEFAGQSLTMHEIYEKHSVGRPYIERNYKAVLIELEIAGRIKADPPVEKRRPYKGKPSFANDVNVSFPP